MEVLVEELELVDVVEVLSEVDVEVVLVDVEVVLVEVVDVEVPAAHSITISST